MVSPSYGEDLWVGQTYQCFLEDYANRSYSWVNIDWNWTNGLYINSYGSYVTTISFDKYMSGTYEVSVKWSETNMSDSVSLLS